MRVFARGRSVDFSLLVRENVFPLSNLVEGVGKLLGWRAGGYDSVLE